ncbi:MAG: carboxypeptidase regulatory-like domain-containing protein [Bryobacter sp.]|nr:carboxypeptidase regulatory-like domain-containing protein [Bryobacter sp.]
MALLLLPLLSAPAAAQLMTGSIVGTVVDSSQAAVPNATVTLLQVRSGRERTMKTDTAGTFLFGGLDPAEYEVAVSMDGFKRSVRKGLQLGSGDRLSAGSFVLEIGALTETVSVSGQASVVQTESAERADVITGMQAENVPTQGRNIISLVGLLPGVVDRTGADSLGTGQNLSVLGGRQRSNNIAVDGAPAIDIDNGFGYKLNVSQDAVSEVKILISNYQAEYGRMTGSNILIVTKSGAREFHGLGSYFKRHEQFNATNFFDNRVGRVKPRYRFNTWTYNIAGPVFIPGAFNTQKDKLFFFWQQEFWPISNGVTGNRTVPTELERQGNFSQTVDLNNALIPIRDPQSGAPFPGNLIPPSRLDPSGTALLKVFPLPNYFDRSTSRGQFNYVYTANQNRPQRTDTLKLDYNLTSKDTFMWSYNGYKQDLIGTQGVSGVSSNWPQYEIGYLAPTTSMSARYTRIFSPTLINEFQFGMMKQHETNSITDAELNKYSRSTVGFVAGQFNPANNPLNILPQSAFGGVPNAVNIGVDGRFPFDFNLGVVTFDNKLTWTRGAHTIKTGAYFEHFYRNMPVQGLLFNGSVSFARNVNNPLDSNWAFSNAALGVYDSYSEASSRPLMQARANISEFFVQDNWKVNRRLTLDYGVRFYLVPPIADKEDLMTGFVPDRFDPKQAVKLIQPALNANRVRIGVSPVDGSTYPAALIGAIAPNSGNPANGMLLVAENPSYPRALTKNPGVQWSPRLGFAYDLTGDGKTALRGGFALLYNRESMAEAYKWLIGQPPRTNVPVVNYGTLNTLRSSAGLLFPSEVLGRDAASKLQRVMNYSLTIQRDLGKSTLVEVGYVGSVGRNLVWRRPINPVPAGANFTPENIDPTLSGNRPLPPNFLRPIPGYGDISIIEPASSSNYHSLQVTGRRRFSKGLTFGAAWTWSKAMDYNDAEVDVISAIIHPRVWNYGLGAFDRTHVFKLNWQYDLPKLAVSNPVARTILHDWMFSGITTFQSGAPLGVGFSQVVATDITGTASQGARIVVLSNPVLPKSERTFERNFRTEAFALPAVGTFGNAAKTVIRGPGLNNFDIAIFKNFPLYERLRMQFRCEMYNAFNHTQFTGVDTGARFDAQGRQVNGQFGQFTSAAQGRTIQLALRVSF